MLLGCLEWVGERHWLLSFLLYVPPQVWLLPVFPLAGFALWLHRRLLWLNLAGVLLVLACYMDPEWHGTATTKRPVLRILTNNIGENNKTSLAPFLKSEQPDLVLLQEATSRGHAYLKAFPEYYMAERSEFVLLSRWPIRNAGLLPILIKGYGSVAAWFEVEWQGQTLVVYNVHMASPRRDLYKLRGTGLLVALAGSWQETGRAEEFQQTYAAAWERRIGAAKKFAAHLAREKRPFVVAGDFNMPNHGALYHLFASQWPDAFEQAGWGYGLTFPGYTLNPLTFFGPWLRIDYVFAGPGFRPVYCQTEPGRRSQHRAVAARLAVEMALPETTTDRLEAAE